MSQDWPHWYLPVLWGAAFDGAYSRILQAVRVAWVEKNGSIYSILTANDVPKGVPIWKVPLWAVKHYRWYWDYVCLVVCGTAAIIFS